MSPPHQDAEARNGMVRVGYYYNEYMPLLHWYPVVSMGNPSQWGNEGKWWSDQPPFFLMLSQIKLTRPARRFNRNLTFLLFFCNEFMV